MPGKNGRPAVHARDHEHGGADPFQVVYEDVGDTGTGGGGTTPVFGPYAAISCTTRSPSDGYDYLEFGDVHATGITAPVADTTITIVTAGIYEILAAGVASGYMDALGSSARLYVETNGTTGHYGQYGVPSSVTAGSYWVSCITVLDQQSLDVGDTLKFNTWADPDSAVFGEFAILVRQLA